MLKRIILALLLFTCMLVGKTVDDYLRELRGLTDTQSAFLVASYIEGKKNDLGFTLASIVWKESSFGRCLINKRDGKYGSFGLAQILLQTALRRNKVDPNNRKAREQMINKLITDHTFNLREATKELLYWRKQYRDIKKSKWWYLHMVASYNAGWRGFKSSSGESYFKDISKRTKALKIFFKNKKYWNNFLRRYQSDIAM